MAPSLTSLPIEILLQILSPLNAKDLQKVGTTCRQLHQVATSDELWRPIVQKSLASSPPARSSNVCPLTNPPPPWDPSFGQIQVDRNPAMRERWFAAPPQSEEPITDKVGVNGRAGVSPLFPGAASYFQVYWTFIHHFIKLLGWWIGDLPSYGMIIRIVFDPQYRDGSAAFVCEKVYLVNRLQGMGLAGLRGPWMEANSFNMEHLKGIPDRDGTSIQVGRTSVDVAVPGIKTERLWAASWNDCRKMDKSQLSTGTDIGKILWLGKSIDVEDGSNSNDPAIRGPQGQPSITSRARSLAAAMIFGTSSREARYQVQAEQEEGDGMDVDHLSDDDDDDMLPETGPGVFGQGLSISHMIAAASVDAFENGDFEDIPHHLRTIQQRSGDLTHTIFLSSGAIYTTPTSRSSTDKTASKGNHTVSLRCEKYKIYEHADANSSRPFALKLSEYLPLPPIDFPPPALLPLVRDLDEDEFPVPAFAPGINSSSAYERFIDHSTELQLNTLRLEPCPPYKQWPHLSQPQSSGLRFFPIHSPPPTSQLATPIRSGVGEDAVYQHALQIYPHLDPGSASFDWDSLNGVFAGSYGPWGTEAIYVRSRILTEHDFDPKGVVLRKDEALPRNNGPFGLGHRLKDDQSLEETLHWRAEPYIDVADLQMPAEETDFIKPGCRVIEGVKCLGDPNVPRGSISFRAFSRGQDQDDCISYYPPGSRWATHPPWNGESSTSNATRSTAQQRLHSSPGRVLECGTGRLAMEGFVGAGCWRRVKVKISSVGEIQIHWADLHKVAIARRLIDC